MVRFFAILLMSVYAFSATGATVYLHYCCGAPQKIVLQHDHHDDHADCALCVKHHSNEQQGCCTSDSCDHDSTASDHQCQNLKVELKKTTEEHTINIDNKIFPKIFPVELMVFTLIDLLGPLVDSHALHDIPQHTLSHSSVPIFIRHCTYRI